MKAACDEARHYLVENAVELDDEAMEAYLGGEQPSEEVLKRCLRKAVLTGAFYPILAGSAFKNKGVQPLLDAVVDYLPSPVDIPPTKGIDYKTESRDRAQGVRRRAAVGPGVQDHGRPVRRLADLLPHLLGQARDRHGPAELDARQARAGRPDAADALQQPGRHQGSLRGRHRRPGRPEGHPHRRHPVRPAEVAGDPGAHGVPRSGDRDRHRAEVQGRPGEAGRRARQDGRRGSRPSPSSPTRSRARRS